MKKILTAVFAFLLFATPSMAAEANFILNAQPLGILISPDIDGFSARRSSGFVTYIEEIEGFGSFIPNVRLGLGIDTEAVKIDVTGGVGYLWNAAFNGSLYRGDVALRFVLNDMLTLGPHGGIVMIEDVSWAEDADLVFSEESGIMAGVELTVGRTANLLVSVDYLSLEMDVAGKNGWIPNRSSIDLSGLAIQVGFMGRF